VNGLSLEGFKDLIDLSIIDGFAGGLEDGGNRFLG
jgi:hypothetical protein